MATGAVAGKPASGQKLAWEEGQLCQLLRSPDYNLFPNSAVFESDFVQVTKKGKWLDITNMPTVVSLGVTSSDPCLPLPNVLLMARSKVLDKGLAAGDRETPELPMTELIRLLPLRYVRLSVHRATQQILRLRTVTQKVYYLQLHQDYPQAVFGLWSRLADILKKGLSTTSKDPAIRIRHSLVPSGSSPSSSSSGESFCQAAREGRGRAAASGDFCGEAAHSSSGRRGGRRPGAKRVSFQQLPAKHGADVRGDVSTVHRSIRGRLHDTTPLPVCTQCKRCLPQCSGETPSTRQRVGVQQLQQQEPDSWLKPLSRLWRRTLEAAGSQ